MPIFLRQSTASQEVPLGYFVDSTDGNTEETALSIANTDIKIWKTGATTLANKNSGGGTHISNGIYHCTLDATDTDTIGPLVVFIHVSGALTVRLECCVLDEAVYDSLFGTSALTTGGALTITSGRVNADVTHWLGTAAPALNGGRLDASVGAYQSGMTPLQPTVAGRQLDVSAGGEAGIDWANIGSPTTTVGLTGTTVGLITNAIDSSKIASAALAAGKFGTGFIQTTSFSAGAIDAAAIAADAIGASELAADAVAEIADAVWDELRSGHAVSGSFGEGVASVQGNVTGNVGGNLAGSVGSVAAGVTVATNNDKTGYALSAAGVAAIFTRQMTESYAAVGAAPTLEQALFATMQGVVSFSISGTTLTVKKIDGTTTAYVCTLDDATNPTSRARTT